jgi:hypothetical protein
VCPAEDSFTEIPPTEIACLLEIGFVPRWFPLILTPAVGLINDVLPPAIAVRHEIVTGFLGTPVSSRKELTIDSLMCVLFHCIFRRSNAQELICPE